MAISHVVTNTLANSSITNSSQSVWTSNDGTLTATNNYSQTATYADLVIPAAVQEGDLVFVGSPNDPHGIMVDSGIPWIRLGTGISSVVWKNVYPRTGTKWLVGTYNYSSKYNNITTPNGPIGSPTVTSSTNDNNMTGNFVSAWRGAYGVRDFSQFLTSGLTAPGVYSAVDNVVLLAAFFIKSASGPWPVTVTPAVTQRIANRNSFFGTDPRATAGMTPGYTLSTTALAISALTITEAIAPLPASITSPSSGSTVDFTTSGNSITWVHNKAGINGSASGPQNAYALRRKIGVGAYEYWNAGTATWGAITWNIATVGSVTFPAGQWANNNTYDVSVATQENGLNLQGPFSNSISLVVRTPPIVTVTAPISSIFTTSPTVTWSVVPAVGSVYTGWELKIFNEATYTAVGFSANTSTAFWTLSQLDTGLSFQTFGLLNAITYRAFVRARQTGDQWGPWAYSEFTVIVDSPASPIIFATPLLVDGQCPSIQVDLQGRDNVLTSTEADFEGAVAPGFAGANTTIALSTVQKARGTKSLLLTRTPSIGDASWVTGRNNVNENTAFTVRVKAYPTATARTFTATVIWYNATGSQLGSFTISSTEVLATWTELVGSTVSPVGATGAELTITIIGCVINETHHIDMVSLNPNGIVGSSASTVWSAGGLGVAGTINIQASDDSGVSWRDIRGGSAVVVGGTQFVSLYDYETQWGSTILYRARRTYDAGGGNIITGAWSDNATGILSPADNSRWILDPLDTTTALELGVRSDSTRNRDLRTQVVSPPSRRSQIVIKALTGLETGSTVVSAETVAKEKVLGQLLSSGNTLLMHSAAEEGEWPAKKYLAPIGNLKVDRIIQGQFKWRDLSFDWTEQDRPR